MTNSASKLAAAALAGFIALSGGLLAQSATAAPAPSAEATNKVDQRAALWKAAERDGLLTPQSASRSTPSVTPNYFVDDPRYFFYWREQDPAQDCFPGLNCEIEQIDMYVPKDSNRSLVTLAYTDRPTDGSIPTSPAGLVAAYLDTEGDSDWDYATLAPNRFFAVDTYYDWYMYFWNGSDWIRMNIEAIWYRGSNFWGAIIPWRELDITKASLMMEICDIRGACDLAPGAGTPRIEIKGAVDGLLPSAPSTLTASYSFDKKKRYKATVRWRYKGPGGPNSIISYQYRVSGNSGQTWTAWKSTTSNRVIVTGLKKGQVGAFEVRAQNRSGYGPAARIALKP